MVIKSLFTVTPGVRFLLASSSPRRREMFASLGIDHQVHSPDVDESLAADESPADAVSRLSRLKARAAAESAPDSWILAADTMVVKDGVIYNKPQDGAEAQSFLSILQGAVHEVWGGFCILSPGCEVERVKVSTSRVRLRTLDADLIAAYVRTGEPMDKAGAYAVQGVGASFIEAIDGSYTNVVGLDLAPCIELLLECGVLTVER